MNLESICHHMADAAASPARGRCLRVQRPLHTMILGSGVSTKLGAKNRPGSRDRGQACSPGNPHVHAQVHPREGAVCGRRASGQPRPGSMPPRHVAKTFKPTGLRCTTGTGAATKAWHTPPVSESAGDGRDHGHGPRRLGGSSDMAPAACLGRGLTGRGRRETRAAAGRLQGAGKGHLEAYGPGE